MAKVYDGSDWHEISESVAYENGTPIKPVLDGDGNIFLSIPSYRDGERCGETLKSLFENAAHPEKIFVGVVEQNSPEDKFCLEAYCEAFGSHSIQRSKVREGVVKIITNDSAREKCPYYNQVRLVAYHDIQAKGPMLARSMARKVLGNEEFCMQIDAHTDFVKHWDTLVVEEWKKTENEFGVLSNVPADKVDKEHYVEGGDKFTEVPRQCMVRFLENGFPDYTKPADGKVKDIAKPLLGHGWSAAFSFAKCHLEESAPYDNFSWWAMPVEQYSRYARMWTRGYDVYTPTRNIVFHDYGEQMNGHGNNEWFKRQRDRFRKDTLTRVKTALQIPGGEADVNDQANLGIYGLGKRRTLAQLSDFAGVDLLNALGNMGPRLQCTDHKWVPYDGSISPTENLFSNPDNLDPQPEYPLRTKLVYYQQVPEPIVAIEIGANKAGRVLPASHVVDTFADVHADPTQNMPPISVLLIFWVFGLIVWYLMFMSPPKGHGNIVRKKSSNAYKDV